MKQLLFAACITSLIIMTTQGTAIACRTLPSLLTPQEELALTPLAFIGRVISIAPGTATFAIERMLHGNAGSRMKVPSGTDTCMHNFSVGDKWLYAGSEISGPTTLIIPDKMGDVRLLVPDIQ